MNKFSYFFILVLIFCGCAGAIIENSKDRFVNDRNYDVGRRVDWSYATPSEIIKDDQNQDKYLFKYKNGCQWIYYVNKETKIVESWEYISSPEKCSTGLDWFGIW